MGKIKVYLYREKDPRDKTKYRPFWYVQWSDPKTGRKRSKSSKCSKRRDAERFAGKLEKELNEGTYRNPSNTSWAEFRDRFETESLAKHSDGNFGKASATFNAVESILAPLRPSDIDTQALSRFAKVLRDGRTIEKDGKDSSVEPLAEATIKSHFAHLRAALQWAKEMGMIDELPSFKTSAPDVKKKAKGRAITLEEFERMLDATPKIVGDEQAASWHFLLRGLWLSGLRLGEALNLYWDRMDAPDDEALWLEFGTKYPMFDIRDQKNGQDTLLPMTPDFAEFLKAVPEDRRRGRVFLPMPQRAHGDSPLQIVQVSRNISQIGEEAKIIVARNGRKQKFASAHDMRRSFGTRWSKRVMPAVLQQLMRHATIQTTMEFYVEQDAQDVAAIVWGTIAADAGNASHNASHSPTESSEEGIKNAATR